MMNKILLISAVLALSASATPSRATIKPPQQLVQAKPAYPVYAYANRISGYVKINFDVGTDGKVSELRIVESNPPDVFDKEVIKAVAKWRFVTDQPVKNIPLTLSFKINSSELNNRP